MTCSAAAASYTSSMVPCASRELLERGVAHRREHDAVVPGQRRQHGQQPLLDRGGLQRRQQYDERALPAERR